MSHLVAVTGASGHIGRELCRLLLEQGHRVRAIARGAEGLAGLEKAGAEPALGSVEDAEFLARSFDGVSAAFVMIPPNPTAADLRAWQNRVGESLCSALERALVPKVVHLSSVGAHLAAGTGPIGGLHDSELRLARLDAPVLHLRPTFFLENFLSGIGLIRAQGIHGGGLRPDLKLAMIATRDIARAAAEALTSLALAGKSTRELLGPREYDLLEVTRALGAAIGKPDLPYVQFPYEGLREAMIGMGMSAGAAGLTIEMIRGLNDGRIAPLEARGAANTTPSTIEQFAREVFAPALRAA